MVLLVECLIYMTDHFGSRCLCSEIYIGMVIIACTTVYLFEFGVIGHFGQWIIFVCCLEMLQSSPLVSAIL